jgi:hypothetical protein
LGSKAQKGQFLNPGWLDGSSAANGLSQETDSPFPLLFLLFARKKSALIKTKKKPKKPAHSIARLITSISEISAGRRRLRNIKEMHSWCTNRTGEGFGRV